MDEYTKQLIASILIYGTLALIGGAAAIFIAARLFQKAGRNDISLQLNRIMAKVARNDGMPHIDLARSLVSNGLLEEAAQEYIVALQLAPNAQTYMELAETYEKMDRIQDAVNTYQSILVLAGPNPPDAAKQAIADVRTHIARLQQSQQQPYDSQTPSQPY